MKYFTSLLFLLLCLNIQAQQFRMVSSGIISWSVLSDSTYSATINFNADLTGGSFNPTQIVDTFQMFTDNQQLYTVDSVLSTSLSDATLRVKEVAPTNGTPSGQVMVYNPQGKSAVPTVNFGSTGASAKMQAAVITYNSGVAGTGSGTVDSTRLVQDSILIYYQDGVEVSRDTIPVSLGGGGGGLDEAAVAAIVGDSLVGVDRSETNEIQDISYTAATRDVAISGGTGFTFPEATTTDPGLLSSFWRTRLGWQGFVNFNDILIGGTMDPDSIISIAGVGTEGKNIYIGDRTYNTGAVALRKLATHSDNGIFLGRGVGIGGVFAGGNIIAGYQSGAFADLSGSTFAGYVAGRNASGTQQSGFGYKVGINSHGNFNLYGGYLAGRNYTGDYNIILENGAGVGFGVVQTINFDSTAIDLTNQRIYLPSHGITDSVFTGVLSTTGTVDIFVTSALESTRAKFQIVGTDSVAFWNYHEKGHYYLNDPILTSIGNGTHSLAVNRSRDGVLKLSPRGNIGAPADEGVALGNTATRDIRIGQDKWSLPGTESGTNQSAWRNKVFAYNYASRRFDFNRDTTEFKKIIAVSDGNSFQAQLRANVNSKPAFLSLVALDGTGTPIGSIIRGDFDGSVEMVNSAGSIIGTRPDGLSFGLVGASGGTGTIADLNVFEVETSGGADARYININRAGTGTGNFAGYRMEQNGEISIMQFNNSTGTYEWANNSDNDGFFRWRTLTSAVTTERMRLTNAGNLGIGQTTPTAVLHLKAGTATASTAPIKFAAGTNLIAPEAGAMEWDGTNLHITQTTGPTRKTLAYTDAAGLTDDQDASEVPITDSGGYYAGTEVEAALQEVGPAYGEAHSTGTNVYSSGGTQVIDTLTSTYTYGFSYSAGVLTNNTGDTVIAKVTFSATVQIEGGGTFTVELKNGSTTFHNGAIITESIQATEAEHVSGTAIVSIPTGQSVRATITSIVTDATLSNVSLTVEKLRKQ